MPLILQRGIKMGNWNWKLPREPCSRDTIHSSIDAFPIPEHKSSAPASAWLYFHTASVVDICPYTRPSVDSYCLLRPWNKPSALHNKKNNNWCQTVQIFWKIRILYRKTLIIHLTLIYSWASGHHPEIIHETLFLQFFITSSLRFTLKIIDKNFFFWQGFYFHVSMLSWIYAKLVHHMIDPWIFIG